jgi:hypothetical protein
MEEVDNRRSMVVNATWCHPDDTSDARAESGQAAAWAVLKLLNFGHQQ